MYNYMYYTDDKTIKLSFIFYYSEFSVIERILWAESFASHNNQLHVIMTSMTSPRGRRGLPRLTSSQHLVMVPDTQMDCVSEYPPSRQSVVSNTSIVDSPRKIMQEKTKVGDFPTPLTSSLELFHEEMVNMSEKKLFTATKKIEALVEYMLPRIIKLGNQMGLKILGVKYAGSTFDDTQTMLPYDMDVFLLFDRHKTKIEGLDAGYMFLPLKKYRPKKISPPDEFRFGRSEDGLYVSSMLVARNMYDVVERALKLHPHVALEPYTIEDGGSQIKLTLKNRYNVSLVPATYMEKEDYHLVSKPYTNDINPWSDMMWRLSFVDRERRILALMDQADRGMRRKAFKILKTLVKVEHTLPGLTSYHIKTVLLHSFDSDVDCTPRWQRNSVQTCFLGLLADLHEFLAIGSMPHFFVRGCNLLAGISRRTIITLRMRTGFLLSNKSELVRVLRKRATEQIELRKTSQNTKQSLKKNNSLMMSISECPSDSQGVTPKSTPITPLETLFDKSSFEHMNGN